jgi:T5SS/PEP-CTERM-associated repeat protein
VRNGSFVSQGTNVIASGAGSAASLTLAAGASLNSANGSLGVGVSGTGVFNIREGSDALVSSLTAGVGTSGISSPPGHGSVNVSGLGSMLTVSTGATLIGEYGVGAVSVLDGGRLTTGALTLGAQNTGQGSVLLGGPGSTWQINGRLDVGAGSGTIAATGGARIQSGSARLGNTPTSTTTVLLSGTDTLWSNAGSQFEVGALGNASFTVADGASLSLAAGTFGSNGGSFSAPLPVTTLRITGAGSSLKASQTLSVGMFGKTNLIVEDGGTLTAAGLFFGTSPGPGIANVSIDGAGSTIALAQQSLLLNRQNVSITNGGTLATSGASIAIVSPDSAVTVRIAGHGSSWTSAQSQPFQVGQTNGGLAEVYLEDGGQLTAYSLNIVSGFNGPTNVVSVRGEGSRLTVGSNGGPGLQIGATQPNSPAELRVTEGGTVSTRAPIRINTGGRLILDGGGSVSGTGVIDNLGYIRNAGGTITSSSTINNQGEIHLDGDDAHVVINGTLANTRLLHGTGRVAGNVSNIGTGEIRAGAGDRLVFAPAPTTTSTLNNAGRIVLMDGGAIELQAGMSNAPTGTVTFTNGGSLHWSASPGTPPSIVRNAGQVLFSAGTSDVFPSLDNHAPTSQVIVTGNGTATFHGPVLHTAGEFRVSDGSTAVFLAPVTGSGQFTGGGAKFFEAGQSNVAALESGGDTAVQAPAGITVTRFSEDSLTVRGRLDVDSGPQGATATNVVNTLAIEGDGVVDLSESDLLINSDADTQAAVLARVEQYVASARNAPAGRWTGPGLTSGAAAGAPLTTLAVGTSGDDHNDDVRVRYTYNGDANLDGRVNADDYFRIDQGFLRQPSEPLFAQGDFNYDGRVNADDYFLIDQAFLGQGDVIGAGALAAVAAVPEPGVASLLALGGLLAIRRRR